MAKPKPLPPDYDIVQGGKNLHLMTPEQKAACDQAQIMAREIVLFLEAAGFEASVSFHVGIVKDKAE